ncbi:MAG: 3-methyl-2-oxobutanoate hydroxymethyltransferase [Paludibacter sp.]|nr:3-methyl-2-oxobutanoate hydroxymethyltransferase [Bacteroidales bacterium]MCM1069611.1 3-methyl-2-oxobutanoate hydroxymethyltransferase [Prevotella sp.]MCM1354257.1 3-methyl-2-oxobutanoate hydroxymethyltransferase [Bacteroides sp.]MCM1443096.1 3-methyl-2-oxobutanoate hydroxymethyltransferase [Muribaculum sp.]MCM1482331.1 3-methyl-2-oxobutanoate hydroxymethyltransferase [Paludibacter sp.]
MSVHQAQTTKVTTQVLRQMKRDGEKIAMLTSYDYTLASLVDAAGVDIILVGDSASNVVCGNSTTLPITLDEMIFIAKGVRRAAKRAFVLVDMPFGSYQASEDEAVANAIRVLKETGADGLKLEGGAEIVPAVRRMVAAGVPVMGHLGLTPQSINKFGGYGLRAKEQAEAQKLLDDSKLLEQAGCFALLYEKIPAALGKQVTESVNVPTIGIGAGNGTDGQVLVLHDMLGITQGFRPKFLRHFAELGEQITAAIGNYVTAVKEVTFPNETEQY